MRHVCVSTDAARSSRASARFSHGLAWQRPWLEPAQIKAEQLAGRATAPIDGQDEEEDSDARWTRLEAEEAAAARKEARARARAQAEARHPFTDDEGDPNDHSLKGNSSSSDASTQYLFGGGDE
jgi:hypothetical protein